MYIISLEDFQEKLNNRPVGDKENQRKSVFLFVFFKIWTLLTGPDI